MRVERERTLRSIRRWTMLFMAVLIISGLTAVPLEWGTRVLVDLSSGWPHTWHDWAVKVHAALVEVNEKHHFLFYGTDWLAFAHVVIALAFVDVLRDPVRNQWIIDWALITCLLVVLFAFGWAPVRGIPFFWRCVDASFGIIAAIPLWHLRNLIRYLEPNSKI